MIKMHKKLAGIALSEYGLSSVLVLGGLVFTLSHGSIFSDLQQLILNLTHGNLNGNVVQTTRWGKLNTFSQAVQTQADIPALYPDVLNPSKDGSTDSNGFEQTTVALPASQQSTDVETLGGLGGAVKILSLADQIKAIAQKMKAQNAPDWLTQYITDMALDGHTTIGNMLQGAWTACPPDAPCNISDWSTFGGYEARSGLVSAISGKPGETWNDPNGIFFVTAYNAILTANPPPGTGSASVWAAELSKFPEARQAILDLSVELMQVAKGNAAQFISRAKVARDVGLNGQPPSSSSSSPAQNAQATGTIHNNSNAICTTGGDRRNCTQ
jgi:hypothetical protein